MNNGLIKFNLKPPASIEENISLEVSGSSISASFIHTGSPHVVIVVDDIDDVPVIKIGREIRYSESFAPEGTNVNFIETTGKKIFIRTYERGVEDETYACGTGAVAAAIIGNIKFGVKPARSLCIQKEETNWLLVLLLMVRIIKMFLSPDQQKRFLKERYL